MRHPFQCIASLSTDTLVAACGPTLVLYDLNSRQILSEWSAAENSQVPVTSGDQNEVDTDRPAKKQKTSASSLAALNVIKLAVADDEKHLVAVTEDKAIRVLEVVSGKLQELSQRVMPKRPCAIQVVPGSATILCADKFGDVYSLPLLHSVMAPAVDQVPSTQDPSHTESKFKPSASALTVHSQRNRQALEAQMNQKNFTPRKETLAFEHKLLLGHVSMLTDMKYIQDLKNTKKAYVLTADRDEHIRISRAPPQTHIIEGFCLGHTSFISKICQVGRTNLLVSGGGDAWLCVWDWQNFRLQNKLDLLRYVRTVPRHEDDEQLAVSGIWSMSMTNGSLQAPAILVVCEKVEALFLIDGCAFTASDADIVSRSLIQVLPCRGSPLDIALVTGRAIVSLDMREEATMDRRIQVLQTAGGDRRDHSSSLEPVKVHVAGDDAEQMLTALNKYSVPESVSAKQLDDLLYGVSNLRKRGHQDADEGQGEANGE